jgi:hypothetical protein
LGGVEEWARGRQTEKKAMIAVAAVVPELLSAGHDVVGLARSDASAAALTAAGAVVRRGDLDDLRGLQEAPAAVPVRSTSGYRVGSIEPPIEPTTLGLKQDRKSPTTRSNDACFERRSARKMNSRAAGRQHGGDVRPQAFGRNNDSATVRIRARTFAPG